MLPDPINFIAKDGEHILVIETPGGTYSLAEAYGSLDGKRWEKIPEDKLVEKRGHSRWYDISSYKHAKIITKRVVEYAVVRPTPINDDECHCECHDWEDCEECDCE